MDAAVVVALRLALKAFLEKSFCLTSFDKSFVKHCGASQPAKKWQHAFSVAVIGSVRLLPPG